MSFQNLFFLVRLYKSFSKDSTHLQSSVVFAICITPFRKMPYNKLKCIFLCWYKKGYFHGVPMLDDTPVNNHKELYENTLGWSTTVPQTSRGSTASNSISLNRFNNWTLSSFSFNASEKKRVLFGCSHRLSYYSDLLVRRLISRGLWANLSSWWLRIPWFSRPQKRDFFLGVTR